MVRDWLARRVPVGAALVAVVIAVTAAVGTQQTRTVTILYDAGSGLPSASPDTVYVSRGQPLEWTSAHPWRVNVPLGSSIFGSGQASGTARSFSGDANQRSGASVLPNAAAGGYKYDVAVFVDGQWRTRDPEIVVTPSGGGDAR